MVKRMDENKDQPKKVSTCFEGPACAAMIEKISGEEKIGSLCQEMMRSWAKKKTTRTKKTGGVK